ncbi:MAG: hypothetical protein LBG15_07490 [Dysgonamonadaceae bacterium]|jgi:hypothetical protein|nr:hypothetical protein [Dysgonamonadaceae bacterium]
MKRNEQKKQHWQEKQAYLFSLIKAQIPKNIGFIYQLEEVLNIGTTALYQRIKGETELKLSELCILCSKYNISMDKIMNYHSGQDMLFEYLAVNPAVKDTYTQYLQQLCERHNALSQSTDCEFIFTAAEIPFYYFPYYPELLYFKLYERYKILNGQDISYEYFYEQFLDKDLIIPLYKQMTEVYMQIPSVKEIWCDHTISGILQSLKYCATSKCFENKETVLSLLKQLLELTRIVEKEAGAGTRKNQQASFYLYVSPVDVTNNIILIRNGKKTDCDIRLYTANSLFTNDEKICSDICKDINELISKSMLISHRLKQERSLFFENMQNKINDLIPKI